MFDWIIVQDILLQAGAAVRFIDQILNTIIERNNPSDRTACAMIKLLTSAKQRSMKHQHVRTIWTKKENDTPTSF